MISGYFLYHADIAKGEIRIKKSLKRISSIYFIAFLLYWGIAFLESLNTGNYNALKIGPWKLFVWITNCSNLNFPYGFHLWFLIALIEGLCCMWFINIHRISPKLLLTISVCVLCVGMVMDGIVSWLGISFMPFAPLLFTALPYLCIGYALKQRSMASKYVYSLLVIAVLIAAAELKMRGFQEEAYWAVIPLSVGLVSLCFSSREPVTTMYILRGIALLGQRYSLWIYVLHVAVLSMFSSQYLGYSLTAFPIFLITLILSIFLKELYGVLRMRM